MLLVIALAATICASWYWKKLARHKENALRIHQLEDWLGEYVGPEYEPGKALIMDAKIAEVKAEIETLKQ
jgi:hypothetical protein